MIYTIGHSTASAADFTTRLVACDIERLVDVRSLPGSRRYPHFDKEAMPGWLPCDYRHLPTLGGRRRGSRTESPNTGWVNASFRNYADHGLTPEFRDGLDELVELATGARTVFMCSEAVPWRCHRSLIATALVLLRGQDVTHVVGGKLLPHVPGQWGPRPVVVGGVITYPPTGRETAGVEPT